jgi:hypothetical protein
MNRYVFLLILFLVLVQIAYVSVSASAPPVTSTATKTPTFTETTLVLAQSSNRQTNACLIDPGTVPFPDAGYCFLQGLIHPITGLVRSREGECFTTVYKNSLATMAFIHQGDMDAAERIFDFFQDQLATPFPGFRQAWDACNGQPNDSSDYWEGDNAFLLLALDYYAQVTGTYGSYDNLADALKVWLTERADLCDGIIAEGVANMHAALVPFGSDWDSWQVLSKLHQCFFNSVDYPSIADHTVRGALAFGDITGFESLSNFERTETWQCDENTSVRAYAAFSSDSFINVEISAQLLLAWRLWQHGLSTDLSFLRSELEKLRLLSEQTSLCSGLPYLVRHPANGGFDGDYSLPIVDATVYLLYDYWSFNPFAPGERQAGCRYDKFIQLITDGQGESFPRIFHSGQDPLDPTFPQEINDGNHRQIVVEFTTSRDLSQVPITLTVDTVARSQVPITLTVDTVARDQMFGMSVKLDDGDHCLGVCDRSGVYANSNEVGILPLLDTCNRVFLPMIAKNVTTGTVGRSSVSAVGNRTYTYQLVLEGTSGWGVFDWLQLETPDQVLWTIGNKDNQCDEFDNTGFVYPCD